MDIRNFLVRKQTNCENEQEIKATCSQGGASASDDKADEKHEEENISQGSDSRYNDSHNETTSSIKKKAKVRTFQDNWLSIYPWLKRASGGGMLCNTCLQIKGVENPFTAAEGCTNYQNSTLLRHEASKMHTDSILKLQMKKNFEKTRSNVEQQNQQLQSETINSHIIQLRTVYMMCKRDIPADAFSDLMDLQVLNGVKCDHVYKRPQVITEFEECIEKVLNRQLLEKLNGSDFIGIMLDETCDISVEKKLAVYARYVQNGEACTSFIGNEKITDCTAAGIEKALVDFLTGKGITGENVEKVFGLGTDGAAVMTGRLNGLGAKLKRRNPNLVQVHCVAHRLNLAVSQAAKGIEYCKQYHNQIHSLYKFYSDSSVRYDKLRELQTLLHGKSHQINEPTSVRWLSVESVVKMIFASYDAIYMSFDSDDKSPKAIGLFKFISNSLFLLLTALLIDILTVIGVLSLIFQRDSVNLSHIKHSVQSTQETLNNMKQGSNLVNEVMNSLGPVPQPGQKSKYKELDIVDNIQLRQRFTNLREQYINALTSNLDDRFPVENLNILACFNTLLNPNSYPENANDLQNYGMEQLTQLCDFYSTKIDRQRATAQFLQFKHFVKSYRNTLSFANLIKLLINDFRDIYPDFVTLAKIALIIPVSSAPCERGFSVQNSIKTKVRNRINPERLNRLMFIKLIGPDTSQFDFAESARLFRNMKERK